MRKIRNVIAALALALPATALAQVETDAEYGDEAIVMEEYDDETVVMEEYDGETPPNATPGDDIVMPEAMTLDVDSLLRLYNNGLYLQTDADCDLPNVNPTYEPAVYEERLAKLPTIIEMPYNEEVQKFIDRYANNLRRSVSVMLGAANFYIPIFEEALESYRLPLELKYLPIIESSLNPSAVSRAGATGLWQFMLTTGKQYGLEVNTLVDERRDPIKSSYAAAHFLYDLYRIFGDWTLAIAAYNCGPENVSKAIHRAGGAKDFWKIYPYLPRETRGYVPAFIAANYIMNYYCEHNICPMVSVLPAKTDTVSINRDVHFGQIAQVLGIDSREIEVLNPQYRASVINGSAKPSTLRLRTKDIIAFIDNEDSIYAYKADEYLTKRRTVEVDNSKNLTSRSSSRGRYVTIRRGDTLSQIAKRNGTTVAKLKKLNPSIRGTKITAGKKIRVR